MLNLQNNPRVADVDGSILWIINEFTYDEWMHTLTRLNKFCFLVSEETEYLPYLEIVARTFGPYCSNLSDFVEYYQKEGWVISDEQNNGDKKVYKLTSEGEAKLNELVSEEQCTVLSECLAEWEDKSNLSLIEEVRAEYPEYRL